MRTAMTSLLWKEWREQRWKAGLGCVLCMGTVAVGMMTRVVPDIVILVVVFMFASFLLPMLNVMDIFFVSCYS